MTGAAAEGRVLIDAKAIRARVDQLGVHISADYKDLAEPLLLVGILKGSLMFLADLCRVLTIPVEIDFMSISSYESGTDSTGAVRILHDLEESIAQRQVLIVEDIVDTGLTINYLVRTLTARKPAGVKVCTLLDKPERRQCPVPLAYTGFTTPNEFVIGYGMDLDQRFRNLPHISVLETH